MRDQSGQIETESVHIILPISLCRLPSRQRNRSLMSSRRPAAVSGDVRLEDEANHDRDDE